jgi:hypothetical protein
MDVWEWADFLYDRWCEYCREKGVEEKDGEHLNSFMAGGHAVLDAILKLDAKRGGTLK